MTGRVRNGVRCAFLECAQGLSLPSHNTNWSITVCDTVTGGLMRIALIIGILTLAAPAFAQSQQVQAENPNPSTPMMNPRMNRRSAPRVKKSIPASANVPPETPIVTLDGVCDLTQASKKKECKTVLTRAQIESVFTASGLEISKTDSRQFAINYARLLAASAVAQSQHLDKDPAVADQIQAQMKMVRMQVLSRALYQQMELKSQNVSQDEIQKYYKQHQANFEQGNLRRILIPTTATTSAGQLLDAAAVKAKAEELRTRAAAGEDFDQLQQQAYKDLDIRANLPATKLSMVRRTSLPPNEATVLDLQPGEVSPVVELAGALVILKLESKQSLSVETAQAEIKALLQHERMEQQLQSSAKSVQGEFNLAYFNMPTAPDLFPPPEAAQPSPAQGQQVAGARSRMSARNRLPMRPRSGLALPTGPR